MADDWENDDWERADFEVKLPAAAGNGVDAEATKGAKLLSDDPDPSKFAGEDEEEDQPAWKSNVPKTQQKKSTGKKYDENRGRAIDDGPLDDPVLEKLRQQRLIEEADYAATRELFGDAKSLDVDSMIPKSAKDYEQYAQAVAYKYLQPHAGSGHYKLMLKQLLKASLGPLGVQEVKDVEVCVAGLRADKVKAEAAAKAAASKVGKKKSINVGRGGGSAGLDDYQYDTALDDGYDDFM